MPPGPSAGGGRMNWKQPLDLGLVIWKERSSPGVFDIGLLIVL